MKRASERARQTKAACKSSCQMPAAPSNLAEGVCFQGWRSSERAKSIILMDVYKQRKAILCECCKKKKKNNTQILCIYSKMQCQLWECTCYLRVLLTLIVSSGSKELSTFSQVLYYNFRLFGGRNCTLLHLYS